MELLKPLIDLVPRHVTTYYEPFFTNGFFLLNAMDKLENVKEFKLGNGDNELLKVFKNVVNKTDEVIEKLKTFEDNKETFEDLKKLDFDRDFEKQCEILKAARFIYLHAKSDYKENIWGRCDSEHKENNDPLPIKEMIEGANLLKDKNLSFIQSNFRQSFSSILENCTAKSFVFLDPPYYDENRQPSKVYEKTISSKEHYFFGVITREMEKRKINYLAFDSVTEYTKELYKERKTIILNGKEKQHLVISNLIK